MPNKLAILAAALVAFLGMATPALAQVQETAPGGQYEPAPEATCTPQVAQQVAQATGQEEMTGAPPVAWRPEGEDVVNESFEVSGDGGNGSLCTDTTGVANSGNQEVNQAPACASCGVRVAQAARDALTGGDSDTDTDPADAFGAAINAAHSPGGTEDAAALEQAEAPVQASEAAAYRAAFETAKEAGLDDVAAKDAAGVAVAEARKTRKGGSPSEGIAAAEGKTRKEQTSKKAAAQGKDLEHKKPREDKTREGDTGTDNASEEDVTEDADEEVAASGENDDSLGSGVGGVQTTPAGSRVPLLLGGTTLLSIGGYAGLRFARSWTPVRGRRLLRD